MSVRAGSIGPATGVPLPRADGRPGRGNRHAGQDRQIIFDSISDGVFTVDEDCIITSFNKAAERITGFRAAEAIGKHCFEIFRTEICHKRCALRDTLANHDPVDERAGDDHHPRRPRGADQRQHHAAAGRRRARSSAAVEFFRDLSEVEHLREPPRPGARSPRTWSAPAPRMRRIIEHAAQHRRVGVQRADPGAQRLAARSCSPQAIHNLSPRRYGPYIKLNCAALPATLLESELFGYEKGAFTDAKRDKPGRFALANGGTLLLDEISEMDVSLQVKLLRVLNNGEYQPLGSTKTLRHRCADHRRDQRRPASGRSREGTLPRGPLLPHQRGQPRDPLAARASRGHPAAGRALPREARQEGPKSSRPASRRTCWPCCASTRSRATSASWRTPSSTRS